MSNSGSTMAGLGGPEVYRFDAFQLDPVRGSAPGPDRAELRLRPKAFALLRLLSTSWAVCSDVTSFGKRSGLALWRQTTP